MKTILYDSNRFLFLFLFLFVYTPTVFGMAPPKQEFYQIKIYVYNNKSQEDRLDKFLKDAYLPALQRTGIKNVGVFKPIEGEADHGKKIYVLIPFKNADQFIKLDNILDKDRQYKERGKDYIDAAYNNPPYDRIESIFLRAFMDMPKMYVPNHATPPSERVYELRSYEAATEKLYLKKVHMFNEGGEIKIFDKLKFNAVFYGEVLSGSTMPNLIYMTTFANRAERDKHWSTFRVDPDWEKLKGKEEYNNTVSKSHTYFLRPTDYSGI
jgi:hypothetical protein